VEFSIAVVVAVILLGKPESLHFSVTCLFAKNIMSFGIVGLHRSRQRHSGGRLSAASQSSGTP